MTRFQRHQILAVLQMYRGRNFCHGSCCVDDASKAATATPGAKSSLFGLGTLGLLSRDWRTTGQDFTGMKSHPHPQGDSMVVVRESLQTVPGS